MPPMVFEPTIPASAQPQTYALDRTTTGISVFLCTMLKKLFRLMATMVDTKCLDTCNWQAPKLAALSIHVLAVVQTWEKPLAMETHSLT
jgi:hypothetical protein